MSIYGIIDLFMNYFGNTATAITLKYIDDVHSCIRIGSRTCLIRILTQTFTLYHVIHGAESIEQSEILIRLSKTQLQISPITGTHNTVSVISV